MLERKPKDFMLGLLAIVLVCVPWWVGAITMLKDWMQ